MLASEGSIFSIYFLLAFKTRSTVYCIVGVIPFCITMTKILKDAFLQHATQLLKHSVMVPNYACFLFYQAMAKDDKNYYQDTPKQIRKKIQTFKSIPSQYNAYLKAKEEGTLDIDDS